jgi:hypothetical protein
MSQPLLHVDDLQAVFSTPWGDSHVLRGIDFPAQAGPDERRATCHFLTDALFESLVEAMREYR